MIFVYGAEILGLKGWIAKRVVGLLTWCYFLLGLHVLVQFIKLPENQLDVNRIKQPGERWHCAHLLRRDPNLKLIHELCPRYRLLLPLKQCVNYSEDLGIVRSQLVATNQFDYFSFLVILHAAIVPTKLFRVPDHKLEDFFVGGEVEVLLERAVL